MAAKVCRSVLLLSRSSGAVASSAFPAFGVSSQRHHQSTRTVSSWNGNRAWVLLPLLLDKGRVVRGEIRGLGSSLWRGLDENNRPRKCFWDGSVRIECCRALHSDDRQCCIINRYTFSLAVQDVPFTHVQSVSWLDSCMNITFQVCMHARELHGSDALLAHGFRAIRSRITLKATVVSTLTRTAHATPRHIIRSP